MMLTKLERLKINSELHVAIMTRNSEPNAVKKLALIKKVQELRKKLGIVDNSITITGRELGEFDTTSREGLNDLRAAVKTYLESLRGQTVYCPALRADVEIRMSGIRKYIKFSANPIKLKAAAAILTLIANGQVFKPSVINYDTTEKANGTRYHYLKSKLVLADIDYGIRLVIREDNTGKFHYDAQIKDSYEAIFDSIEIEERDTFLLFKVQGLSRSLEVSPKDLKSIINDELLTVNSVMDNITLSKWEGLSHTNVDKLKKLIPIIQSGLDTVKSSVQHNDFIIDHKLVIDSIQQLILHEIQPAEAVNDSARLICDGVDLAVSELQRNLAMLENNYAINLQESNDPQAKLEKQYIDSIHEAIEILNSGKSVIYDTANDDSYVLNLFISMKNEAGEWVALEEIETDETDHLSDITTSDHYRWKDIGYVAGAKKEMTSFFKEAKQSGQNLTLNDIDWEQLKETPKLAESLIKKDMVMGKPDWSALKEAGMPSEVGYFIKRCYAAVAKAPSVPQNPESQKRYVQAISNFKDNLEACRSTEEVEKYIIDLVSNMLSSRLLPIIYDKDGIEYLLSISVSIISQKQKDLLRNYDALVMAELGESFQKWVFRSANKALNEMNNKQPDSKGYTWDWAKLEPKPTDSENRPRKPRKKSFQLESASHIERIGGQQIKVESSAQLQTLLGLKAVQSGNYVLKDKSSAQFHMQSAAEAMIDMGDILGIEPKLLGLKGHLSLAFGARGKGGALAHYEPSTNVINITKMKGGGSLGHEYFHALDNLIKDLATQTVGSVTFMGTENADQFDDPQLREAFSKLKAALCYSTEEPDIDGYPFPNQFMQNALELDKGEIKYWAKTHEMAARAFTSYLKDKLAEKNQRNDYLAYEGNHRKEAFPQGEDRQRINAAFDELFKIIRDQNILGKAVSNSVLLDSLFNPKQKSG